MTTNEFPRYATVALRDYDDRALRFLAIADRLGIDRDRAYQIADDALDVDTLADSTHDTLLLLAQASFWGDDDYDDFRHELRMAIGGDLADPDYDDEPL